MRLAICLSVALLAGCASGVPVQDPLIKVSDAAGVASCRYLDSVVGTSGWYGLHADKGYENARLYAFDQARKLGATHVVWEGGPISGHGSTSAAAKAYRCS